MLAPVLEALAPAAGKLLVDGTLGGGGHCSELLAGGADVIALDWDAAAHGRTTALQKQYGGRLTRVQAGFGEWADVMPAALRAKSAEKVDGVLLDLGFSSDQLDDPARGLSYHAEGPLDMRLDSRRYRTAAEILNQESEAALAEIFYRDGEEPKSRFLAKAVVAARREKPLSTTLELLKIVEKIYPPRFGLKRAHPAARIFQALRVVVNDEMGQIERVLPLAAKALAAGGKLAVITFQPAEDRLVKDFYKMLTVPVLDGVGRQVEKAAFKAWKKIEPTAAEVEQNPRARSAKLRVLERLSGAGA